MDLLKLIFYIISKIFNNFHIKQVHYLSLFLWTLILSMYHLCWILSKGIYTSLKRKQGQYFYSSLKNNINGI